MSRRGRVKNGAGWPATENASKRRNAMGLPSRTPLGIGLALGLLVVPLAVGFLVHRQAESKPPADPPPAPAVTHPLDPLTPAEIETAVAVLRKEGKASADVFFPQVVLLEPPKEEVLAFRPDRPIPRQAFVIVLDRAANTTHEAVVDLPGRRVLSWKPVPGVQPAVMPIENTGPEKAIKADPRWQAAMKRRGITAFDRVRLDVWARGHVPPPDRKDNAARLLRVLSYYRGAGSLADGRPVEGVVVLFDLNTGKVIDVRDTGVVPLPKESGDFYDPAVVGPLRDAPKPLRVSQPDGVSFEVRGHEVRWQKWRFRYALHPRTGLVLYTVGYEDGDRLRSILYRASLSEMVVPYGDPDETWSFRNAFDVGEYDIGRSVTALRPGHEVPDNARILGAVLASEFGKPDERPAAVALYERDGGMLWTHTDWLTTKVETRRDRQLVLQTLYTVGNYEYAPLWIFHQDGTLELRLELNGIVLVKAVRDAACAVCRQAPDAAGKTVPAGADRYGTLVAPNVVAVNHQHFFCFRLDLDVDGVKNSVAEMEAVPAPAGPANPEGNAFVLQQKLWRTEKDAQGDLSPAGRRCWKVFNPNRTTALGHFPAYVLEPGGNAGALAQPGSALRQRAPFLEHHVVATRQKPGELHAAGDYPNQGAGGEGLPRYRADDEALADEDVVLWYTLGVTHAPRPEEWPVMPAAAVGFRLVPDGFFTRNPALDVPAP
jgi:primary-amine oxidase